MINFYVLHMYKIGNIRIIRLFLLYNTHELICELKVLTISIAIKFPLHMTVILGHEMSIISIQDIISVVILNNVLLVVEFQTARCKINYIFA